MIDLSAIKAKELPKKTVELNILGTKQEQEITVLTGEERIKAWALDYTQNPEEATLKRVKVCLGAGAGLSVADTDLLIRLDWDAAVVLAGEILSFTREFDDAVNSEKANAEKNLKAAAQVTAG